MPKEISAAKAIVELWKRGFISSFKLHSAQQDIYTQFKATTARKFVVNCSRRIGKSWLFCTISDETCRSKPFAQVKYAAPTAKAVRKIIKPLFNEIWRDCPPDLRPKWDSMDQCYRYHNGSEIHIAGTDQGNAENLRGTSADLAIVDEAGFCSELDYLVQDILLPQTLTCNGRIILGSTPPKTPGHKYVSFYLEAKTRGAAVDKTIYDNPLVTPEQIVEYMDESGGANSTTWRREYLALFITDEESQIIPEFNDARVLKLCVPLERPTHFDPYVSMDIGFEDLTFILFGYWDYANERLVIEDEVVLQGSTEVRPDIIATMVRNMETDLWDDKLPYLRVSDTDPILLNDLNQTYHVNFTTTEKDNKEAAVNAVRALVNEDRLYINPRCTSLIAHLRFGVWDKKRKRFERTKEYGHFDGVDALVYLVRNIRKYKNPFPTNSADPNTNLVWPGQETSVSPTGRTFKDLFSAFTKRIGG